MRPRSARRCSARQRFVQQRTSTTHRIRGLLDRWMQPGMDAAKANTATGHESV